MGQIWLALAALSVAVPLLAVAPADADESGPAATPEDHVLGNADAPITIVEYGSLTCPHCAQFDRDTLPKLKAAWIDTGKAKLVFRGFVLNVLDLRAQMLARCAPPDRYFAFIDTLYQSQAEWAVTDSTKAMATLTNIGRLGGISTEQFQSCIADKKLEDDITQQTFAAEKNYKVESTPTFFINGARMDPNGAQPFEVFDKALTAALPKG
jgi:protein-disulfide isomerase